MHIVYYVHEGGHSQGRGERGGDVVMKVTGKTATQSNGSLNLEVHFSRLLTALTFPFVGQGIVTRTDLI